MSPLSYTTLNIYVVWPFFLTLTEGQMRLSSICTPLIWKSSDQTFKKCLTWTTNFASLELCKAELHCLNSTQVCTNAIRSGWPLWVLTNQRTLRIFSAIDDFVRLLHNVRCVRLSCAKTSGAFNLKAKHLWTSNIWLFLGPVGDFGTRLKTSTYVMVCISIFQARTNFIVA